MAIQTLERINPAVSRANCPLPDGIHEYYHGLLARLPWAGGASAGLLRTLGLTSCTRGEGVTSVAVQLALAAACSGRHRVLLVDANLANPHAHRALDRDVCPGLGDVLKDRAQLAECVQVLPGANLAFLAAGSPDARPDAWFDNARLSGLLEWIRREFDLALFDLPSAVQETPAVHLASLLDGTLMVIAAERTRWEVAERTKELLQSVHISLVGAVLNQEREYVPGWLRHIL